MLEHLRFRLPSQPLPPAPLNGSLRRRHLRLVGRDGMRQGIDRLGSRREWIQFENVQPAAKPLAGWQCIGGP